MKTSLSYDMRITATINKLSRLVYKYKDVLIDL
jgi:hypothetical protein